MSLVVSYTGESAQNLYCILFQEDDAIAFASGSLSMAAFTHSNMPNYVWYLTENTSFRSGFYKSIDFSSYITTQVEFSVEVRQQVGATPNYTNDILKGIKSFLWNGQAHLEDHQPIHIDQGDYLGTFNTTDTVRGEIQLYNQFGILTLNPTEFNFAVRNPSGLVVATGYTTGSDNNWPYHRFSFQPSGAGFGVGNYIVQVSGSFSGIYLKTNHYFTLSTGININATATALVDITQFGYATGIINDAGATTTVFTTTLPSTVDNFYNGQILRFTESPYYGQGRIISDYVGSTKTITLNKALGFTPASGSKIVVNALGGEFNV